MARALLVIDMQEGILPVLWRGSELAERIAALARAARSQGVAVIAIQQTGPTGSPFVPHELSVMTAAEAFPGQIAA